MLPWWWKVDDARTPQAQPVAAIGQPIDLGRSVLTPQALELRRGQGQIVLTALIENVTAETQTAVFGLPAKPPEHWSLTARRCRRPRSSCCATMTRCKRFSRACPRKSP